VAADGAPDTQLTGEGKKKKGKTGLHQNERWTAMEWANSMVKQ
jgi:hypothetical protein